MLPKRWTLFMPLKWRTPELKINLKKKQHIHTNTEYCLKSRNLFLLFHENWKVIPVFAHCTSNDIVKWARKPWNITLIEDCFNRIMECSMEINLQDVQYFIHFYRYEQIYAHRFRQNNLVDFLFKKKIRWIKIK